MEYILKTDVFCLCVLFLGGQGRKKTMEPKLASNLWQSSLGLLSAGITYLAQKVPVMIMGPLDSIAIGF